MDSLPERCGKIMNDNVALLQYISQNTEMGKSSIQQLIEVVKHEEFRRVIESQYREYDEMYDLAHKALEKRHKEAKSVGPMAKISSYIMINVNAIADGSVSSMAEMMMKGSNKGIIEITKRICKRAGRFPGRKGDPLFDGSLAGHKPIHHSQDGPGSRFFVRI